MALSLEQVKKKQSVAKSGKGKKRTAQAKVSTPPRDHAAPWQETVSVKSQEKAKSSPIAEQCMKLLSEVEAKFGINVSDVESLGRTAIAAVMAKVKNEEIKFHIPRFFIRRAK